jgi:hypothetical protein
MSWKTMTAIRRKILVAAAALLAIAACNTPSVPIPPPNLAAISFAAPATGQAVMSGKPEPRHDNAVFFVINRTTGDGVITTAAADGSFTTTPFAGNMNDTMELSYQTPAGDRSENVCVALVFGAPLVSGPCP